MAGVGSAKFPSSLNFVLKGAISVQSVWLLSQQFLGIFKRVPQAVFGHTLMTVFIAVCAICHPRSHRRHGSTEPFFFRRADICNLATALPCGIPCPHLSVWLPAAEVVGCDHCGLSVLGSQCQSLGSTWQTWTLSNPWQAFPGLSWAHPGAGQPDQVPSASGTCCAQSLLTRWILGVCKAKLNISLLIILEIWLHLVVEMTSGFCPVCKFLLPLVCVSSWHYQCDCFLVCCFVFTELLHRYQGGHKNSNFYLLCTCKKV